MVSGLVRRDEERERSNMLHVVAVTALIVWFVLVGYLLGMLVWRW